MAWVVSRLDPLAVDLHNTFWGLQCGDKIGRALTDADACQVNGLVGSAQQVSLRVANLQRF